jgi:thioesterase domain-containing protein
MLLGFSLGGFVAYDMAKKLTENGDEVCFTGLIDSVAFLAIHNTPIMQSLSNLRTLIFKPFYLFWIILNQPWAGKRSLFINKYKNLKLTIRYLLLKVKLVKSKKKNNNNDQISFLSESVKFAMHDALKKYVIRPSNVEIDLFKAEKSTFYIINRKHYGWSKFSLKGMVIHTLPGEHARIFAAPNDKNFAEVLDKRLLEIEDKLDIQK